VTDPAGYFSWVRWIVIDGNLDTTNEYLHYSNDEITGPIITGYSHNPYAAGAQFTWSPFYLGAHLVETMRATLTKRRGHGAAQRPISDQPIDRRPIHGDSRAI
jgi:hypothetical protein